MVSKFERVFFTPLVYQTFTIRDKESDQDEEFVIQDLPEDLHEKAAAFMIQYYMRDETFQKAVQVSEDSLSEFYRFVFNQKVTIVCFKKGSREIVGMNALSVKTKGIDTSFQSEDERFRRLRSAFVFINSHFDIFDHYNVNDYLYAHGLAISTDYRGKGIATQLLKARIPFMRAHNLSVSSSLFTTSASQKAATKAGFYEDMAMPFDIIKQKFKDFNFPNEAPDNCRLLTLKV